MSGEGLTILKCPYCGSEFRVPEGVATATCPYCGYTFHIRTGEKLEEHYYFKIVFSSSRGFERLLKFIERNFGAPADFITSAELRSATLHYIPIHAVHAEAEGECMYSEGFWFWKRSYEGDFYEVKDYFILGNNEPWFASMLEKFRFGLRGREYFKPKLLKIGKYYRVEVDREEAIRRARELVIEDLRKDLKTGCAGEEIVKNVRIEYLGVTHYPIWEFRYRYNRYKSLDMKALVDASSGRTLYAEYPQTSKARKEAGVVAGLLIGLGALGSALSGSAFFEGGLATGAAAVGAVLGLIAAIPALKHAFESVAKASERLEDWSLNLHLNVDELYGVLDIEL